MDTLQKSVYIEGSLGSNSTIDGLNTKLFTDIGSAENVIFDIKGYKNGIANQTIITNYSQLLNVPIKIIKNTDFGNNTALYIQVSGLAKIQCYRNTPSGLTNVMTENILKHGDMFTVRYNGTSFIAEGEAFTLAQSTKVQSSSVNGNIVINGSDVTIYDDSSIKSQNTNTANSLNAHCDTIIANPDGVHGFRYFNEKLEFWNGVGWVEIETGGGGSFAPANVSNQNITVSALQFEINWTDPEDTTISGTTIAKWKGTKLVRKVGSYPTSVTDGVLIIDNQERSKYSDDSFVDTLEIVEGLVYYYQLFPYSDKNVINTNADNRISSVTAVDPAPANISGANITTGSSKFIIKWSDPSDTAVCKWTQTKLVRKTSSYPTNENDGVLVVTNSVRDQYSSTGYTDSANLVLGTKYYYQLFPISVTGKVNTDAANRLAEVTAGNIPPDNVTNVSIVAGTLKNTIKWTDPVDSGDVVWQGTKLLRRTDRYPLDINDGTIIVDSLTRNQYSTTGYVDNSGITEGTTYYYALFPYATNGAVNKNAANQLSVVVGQNPPTGDVISPSITAGALKFTIKWTDPADSGDVLWSGTKLVRKTGGYPANESDGTLLIDSKTRSQYASSGYVDSSGLTAGVTYYYQLFPYTTTGAVNRNTANRLSGTVINPIPQDCTEVSIVSGMLQFTIKWTDPNDYTNSTWAGTKLVRKTGGYPTSITDGTVIVDSKVRNQYASVGFVDNSGLVNETTYYYQLFPYTNTNAVNNNASNRFSGVAKATVNMGVRWYKTNSSPVLTRLGDSANFSFTPSVGSTSGSSSFDNMSIYKDIKLCNLSTSGSVTAYSGNAGFSRTPASGDVMVEIPKFYFKIDYSNSSYTDFYISNIQLEGYSVSPAHMDRGDGKGERNKIYVSAYAVNSSYRSISGVTPAGPNLRRSSARNGCKGRGSGYYLWDFATWWTINLLYLVEVANWNSQLAVGSGVSDSSNTASLDNGNSDSVSWHSGRSDSNTTEAKNAVKYRHMENLWGNVSQWIDGINYNAPNVYVCLNPSNYTDSTSTNYTLLSYILPSSSGYIKAFGHDSTYSWAMLPTACSGSSSTYICDDITTNGDNWRDIQIGGGYNDGGHCGLFCLSRFYIYAGARLMYLPQ